MLDQIAYPSYFAHRSEQQVSNDVNESRGKHSDTFLEPLYQESAFWICTEYLYY